MCTCRKTTLDSWWNTPPDTMQRRFSCWGSSTWHNSAFDKWGQLSQTAPGPRSGHSTRVRAEVRLILPSIFDTHTLQCSACSLVISTLCVCVGGLGGGSKPSPSGWPWCLLWCYTAISWQYSVTVWDQLRNSFKVIFQNKTKLSLMTFTQLDVSVVRCCSWHIFYLPRTSWQFISYRKCSTYKISVTLWL